MPYRFFLIPLVTALVCYLGYSLFYEIEPNHWILFSLLSLSVACYVLQHQINNFWWSKFAPDMEKHEKIWLLHHLPYIQSLSQDDQLEFFKELSKICLHHEFISMGDNPIHEELKWICLAPAIRLKLHQDSSVYSHFIRTVIYPHPFISPEMEYVHISESHFEDGMMIFSGEQLLLSHLELRKYFNPALYEWCKIFIKYKNIKVDLTLEIIVNKLEKLFDQVKYQEILQWMGQSQLNPHALALYVSIIDGSAISSNIFFNHIQEKS